MKTPTVKRMKVYAVVESVIEGDYENVGKYLKEHKFVGNATTNYSSGGVTNVVTREIIPLTMKQLDSIFNGGN